MQYHVRSHGYSFLCLAYFELPNYCVQTLFRSSIPPSWRKLHSATHSSPQPDRTHHLLIEYNTTPRLVKMGVRFPWVLPHQHTDSADPP
jgi:hypothetical protein